MKNRYQCLLQPVSGWVLILLVIASSSLAQPGSAGKTKNTSGNLISRWSFDAQSGRSVYDEIQQKRDSVYGSFEYVPGISGDAIKLDGFRTYIRRDRHNSRNLEGAFTVEGWIALASYPWSWSPILDCSYERLKGFFFGVGPQGQAGFKSGVGNSWQEAVTDIKIPLREWAHVVAVFDPGRKISVFINGEEAASVDIHGNFVPNWGGTLTLFLPGRDTG
jgi:hypothetical protein